MDLQEIFQLMERFQASNLTQLEWKQKDESIMLQREPAPVLATAAVAAAPSSAAAVQVEAEPKENGEVVTAPLVGTFYVAPAPGEAPFVAPGTRVKKGDTLGLIEAMKMMSQIPAPADCVVEEVLAQDGNAVGYDQPLFRIRRV